MLCGCRSTVLARICTQVSSYYRVQPIYSRILLDGGPTQRRPYFGKCIAFLQDSDGKQFVVLQWFHRHEDNGFDTISRVSSFKLGPEAHTKSYSTLPLHTILNGALMVPGGGRYWAVLSPREHKTYARFFQ